MKIIEALKELKNLDGKVKDLTQKVKDNSARASFETPKYADEKKQIRDWLQSARDTLFRIEELTVALAKTNAVTQMTVKIGDKEVTKSPAAWLIRYRKLAALEQASWASLTDKGVKEGKFNGPTGEITVTIERAYDPKERDEKVEELRSEPFAISAALEIFNAATDLVE